MHHLRIHEAERTQPGGAAARVSDQLRLVNDGGFEARPRVRQLNCRGDDLRVLHWEVFLPGQHAAGDARGVDFIIHFQRQQTQGAQVGTGGVALEILDGVVGLAGVRRADMQHEAAPELPRAADIGLGREVPEEGGDLAHLPLLLILALPFGAQLRDLRMLEHFPHLVLRPDADRPLRAVAPADGLHLRSGEVFADHVLCQAVLPDDLLLIEQLCVFLLSAHICFLFG